VIDALRVGVGRRFELERIGGIGGWMESWGALVGGGDISYSVDHATSLTCLPHPNLASHLLTSHAAL
jgi:hypothetical protein